MGYQRRMLKTEGLTHLHLLVRDLERSLQFYTQVFGLQERFRDGPGMVFLRTPGRRDTITLNQSESPEEVLRTGKAGGIDHFGFRLAEGTDLNRAIQLVEQQGGRLVRRGAHPSGETFAYVQDPDGYLIEL